jgi:hypothetical protein
VEKVEKVLEREVLSVTERFFVTTFVSFKMSKKIKRNANSPILEGITKPAIRRLARRGGVKRISGLM